MRLVGEKVDEIAEGKCKGIAIHCLVVEYELIVTAVELLGDTEGAGLLLGDDQHQGN